MFRIVQSVRELFFGRSLAAGSFTLAVDPATSTTVRAQNCGDTSRIFLTPRSANAAAALVSGDLYVSAVRRGEFDVTHAADASTDLDFDYVALG